MICLNAKFHTNGSLIITIKLETKWT